MRPIAAPGTRRGRSAGTPARVGLLRASLVLTRHVLLVALTLAVLGVAATGADDQPPIVPLLWEVEGSAGRLYLYGSIHAAPPEALPPPAVVMHAFDRSGRLVTEVLLDDDLLASAAALVGSRALLPADVALESLLAPEELAIVDAIAVEYGLPTEAVRMMQPWAIELIVAQSSMDSTGLSTEHGIDAFFHQTAVRIGKPREGLETIEEQIDALSGAPLDEQAASLRLSLADRGSTGLAELYEAWRAGDERTLALMVEQSFSGARAPGGMYDRLITRRNGTWVKPLVGFLNEPGTTFVVVGAGHLVGPDSLIVMLEARGYRIVRLGYDER